MNSRYLQPTWLAACWSLAWLSGCQDICSYRGIEDCSPKLVPQSVSKPIIIDMDKTVEFKIARYFPNAHSNLEFSIMQDLLNYEVLDFQCKNEPLPSLLSTCNVPVSSTDLRMAGFTAMPATIQASEKDDNGEYLWTINAEGKKQLLQAQQNVSIINSQFIFHLDNSNRDPQLDPLEGTDKGLKSVLIKGNSSILVVRNYTSRLSPSALNQVWELAFEAASGISKKKMALETRGDTAFLPTGTSDTVWSAYPEGSNPDFQFTLSKNSGMLAAAAKRESDTIKPLLLAVTSLKQNAILTLNDNSVQWFDRSSVGSTQMKGLLAANPLTQVRSLVLGSTNPEQLFVADSSCTVHRFDADTLAALDTISVLMSPDATSCRLDSLGVGDLNNKGQDELAVVSGSMLYVWSQDVSGKWELMTTLGGLPEGPGTGGQPMVRSIAIGDVNGDGQNDIVVATEKLLYVFLHDVPPAA